MSELIRGVLSVTKKGHITLVAPSKRGPTTFTVTSMLSAALSKLPPASLEGVEVEFEVEAGQPVRVRQVGQEWAAASAHRPQPSNQSNRNKPYSGPGAVRTSPSTTAPRPTVSLPPEFHNPYNFIPAPPRDCNHPTLGDAGADLVGHHWLQPNSWTGHLELELETVTPLLLPDASRETRSAGHGSFPVRRAADGSPLLATTQLKGALRSAYEAITNSRLAVLGDHSRRLAYRSEARDGLGLVPVRVTPDGVEICFGTTLEVPTPDRNGKWHVPENLMYAAWLPRYRHNGGLAPSAVRYADQQLPQHGDEVWAWLQMVRREPLYYWRVERIGRTEAEIGASHPDRSLPASGKHEPLGEWRKARGWVCINNQNIDRKHDERMFFLAPEHPLAARAKVTLDASERERLAAAWRELILDYQAAHRPRDVWERGHEIAPETFVGREPGKTAWSRHIYQNGEPRRDNGSAQPNAAELAPGTLAYAAIERVGSRYHVVALYPVMIARKLFNKAPFELLDASLRPAPSLQKMSAADRVFGWANPNGTGAYAGKLRLGRVVCETADAVEAFDSPGVPLAILGQPKPQQSRFYVANDNKGTPLAGGGGKGEGYRAGQGLRGRKVYPHHANLPQEHWLDPTQDRTRVDAPQRQEYRRPAGERERDDQNRSMLAWVKPGVKFRCGVDVTNLSQVELGALLWLTTLGDEHHLRLGGGKPLGFGSVKVRLRQVELARGEDWQGYYGDLLAERVTGEAVIDQPAAPAMAGAVEAFQEAVVEAYGPGPFAEVSFIRAYLVAALGFGDGRPMHYPRATAAIDPAGENYRWFTANESGPRVALVGLGKPDPGLPFP